MCYLIALPWTLQAPWFQSVTYSRRSVASCRPSLLPHTADGALIEAGLTCNIHEATPKLALMVTTVAVRMVMAWRYVTEAVGLLAACAPKLRPALRAAASAGVCVRGAGRRLDPDRPSPHEHTPIMG